MSIFVQSLRMWGIRECLFFWNLVISCVTFFQFLGKKSIPHQLTFGIVIGQVKLIETTKNTACAKLNWQSSTGTCQAGHVKAKNGAGARWSRGLNKGTHQAVDVQSPVSLRECCHCSVKHLAGSSRCHYTCDVIMHVSPIHEPVHILNILHWITQVIMCAHAVTQVIMWEDKGGSWE